MHNDVVIEDRRTNVKFKDIPVGRFFELDGNIYQKITDYENTKKVVNKAVHLKDGITYFFDDDSEMSPLNLRIIIE